MEDDRRVSKPAPVAVPCALCKLHGVAVPAIVIGRTLRGSRAAMCLAHWRAMGADQHIPLDQDCPICEDEHVLPSAW